MAKYVPRRRAPAKSSSSDVRFGARLVVNGGGQRRLVGELLLQRRRWLGGPLTLIRVCGQQQGQRFLHAHHSWRLVLRSRAGRRGCGRDLVPVNTVLGGYIAGLAQRRVLRRRGEGHATTQGNSAGATETTGRRTRISNGGLVSRWRSHGGGHRAERLR